MGKKSHRMWSEIEKYQIWLAYVARVPVSVVSQYLSRSDSSIHSFIGQSRIRQHKRSCLNNVGTSKKLNLEKYIELLIHCGLDRDTANSERDIYGDWMPSPLTIERLREFDMKLPCPWEGIQHKRPKPKVSLIRPDTKLSLTNMVSMEIVYAYLKRLGYNVTRITKRNFYGWAYMVDGRPLTDFMTLVAANEERLKRGEPVFLVKGITEE